jgi:hypothetical protein
MWNSGWSMNMVNMVNMDNVDIGTYLDNVLFDNILFFSSMIFITNIIVTYYNKYYVYCCFFIMLLITSLVLHFNKPSLFLNLIDKVSIICVSIYGAYLLLKKTIKMIEEKNNYVVLVILVGLSLLTFLFDNYVYFYGYFIGDYCFHENKTIANAYHVLMHILSSMIHNFIVLI